MVEQTDSAFSWKTPAAVRLTANIERHRALARAIERVLGAALPPIGRAAGKDPLILPQGPHDWLIMCANTDPSSLAAALRNAADAPMIASLADGLAEFALQTPDARTLLASGASIDLNTDYFPDGAVAVTRFAQLRATIHRFGDAFRLIVERPVSSHAAMWLTRAAKNARG